MSKSLVQEQFGKTAAFYLTHKPHAQGKSLDRMVELSQPQPDWLVLDVATGGGHVAYAFAPHVKRVWATDLTDEMVTQARAEAVKRGLTNIRTASAKAESLPFEDGTFDLVTCRIAPHHFDSIDAFLAESHRVLKPGGKLVLVDNVVTDGPVGDYINGFERFRDPSHVRALSMSEWAQRLTAQGFAITHYETLQKRLTFGPWAGRHDAIMKAQIYALITCGNAAVSAELDPQGSDDEMTFRLIEGLFIATRS
jgi:ubiquinone/menaquinone biosynthesis C-methylase UbiE